MRKQTLTVLMAMLTWLVAGCASTADEQAGIPLDSDPRVGEPVDRICFTVSLRSWNSVDNDRNAVILEMNTRDKYKLTLSPGCDPQWAMSSIAVIGRPGSSCYSRGDKVVTDASRQRGPGAACAIMKINRWNPEATSQGNGS